MAAQKPFAEDYEPKVERRFVGIGDAMISESPPSSVGQRFIGDAEIAELIRGSKIAENDDREQCDKNDEEQPP